jgi:hypothetical protein
VEGKRRVIRKGRERFGDEGGEEPFSREGEGFFFS